MSLFFWRTLAYINSACGAAWCVIGYTTGVAASYGVAALFLTMTGLCLVAAYQDDK